MSCCLHYSDLNSPLNLVEQQIVSVQHFWSAANMFLFLLMQLKQMKNKQIRWSVQQTQGKYNLNWKDCYHGGKSKSVKHSFSLLNFNKWKRTWNEWIIFVHLSQFPGAERQRGFHSSEETYEISKWYLRLLTSYSSFSWWCNNQTQRISSNMNVSLQEWGKTGNDNKPIYLF